MAMELFNRLAIFEALTPTHTWRGRTWRIRNIFGICLRASREYEIISYFRNNPALQAFAACHKHLLFIFFFLISFLCHLPLGYLQMLFLAVQVRLISSPREMTCYLCSKIKIIFTQACWILGNILFHNSAAYQLTNRFQLLHKLMLHASECMWTFLHCIRFYSICPYVFCNA